MSGNKFGNPKFDINPEFAKTVEPGEPCDHPGCLNHVTHPCEGCGRVAGENHWDPCSGRCRYCGAGDNYNHSFSCPTGLHPDRRD